MMTGRIYATKITMSRPLRELKSGSNLNSYVGPTALHHCFFSLSNIYTSGNYCCQMLILNHSGSFRLSGSKR